MTIHTAPPAGDLSRLRIDRDAARRRRGLPWATVCAVLVAAAFREPRRGASGGAESIAVALVGGVVGCIIALPVNGLTTGAMNMNSFSELAFKFPVTPALLASGLLFSALMGAVGGLLPAIRAARIPVARALREI